MTGSEWPASIDPRFNDGAARARVLHLAEGVLVGLRSCAPEEALRELVSAARSAGLSPFVVANELVAAASGFSGARRDRPAGSVVTQRWGSLLNRKAHEQ